MKNRKFRDRWSKLIGYHPTEWQAKSSAPKWQRLDELLKDVPEVLRHEKERIDNLVFWDELAGAMQVALPKQIHHFHPLGLIDSLSMNTGEVADSELMYLARTIYGEARGQSYASKVAVGWIIRNRLMKGTWGSTYRSVVTARLQFTCWSKTHDPHGYKAIHNPVGQAWDDCQKAAEEVMNAPANANVLPEALNYYSPRAQAQLHVQKPSVYPETPSFAISSKRVPNPPGVSDDDYRFYKG